MGLRARKDVVRRNLVERDGPLCHYCDVPMTRLYKGPSQCEVLAETDATIEHIVPVSIGGSDKEFNLVLVCFYCNAARADELEWCICNFCAEAWKHFRKWGPVISTADRRTKEQVRRRANRKKSVVPSGGYRWSSLEKRWVRDY